MVPENRYYCSSFEETKVIWFAQNHTDTSEQDVEPIWSKAHAFEHNITQLHKDARFSYLTQDHPGNTEVNVIKEKKLKSLNALPATAFPRPESQTLSFPGSSGAMQGQGRCGPLSSQLLTCYYLSLVASSNLFPESNFLLQHLIAPLWMNPISSIYSFYLKTMCLGTGK